MTSNHDLYRRPERAERTEMTYKDTSLRGQSSVVERSLSAASEVLAASPRIVSSAVSVEDLKDGVRENPRLVRAAVVGGVLAICGAGMAIALDQLAVWLAEAVPGPVLAKEVASNVMGLFLLGLICVSALAFARTAVPLPRPFGTGANPHRKAPGAKYTGARQLDTADRRSRSAAATEFFCQALAAGFGAYLPACLLSMYLLISPAAQGAHLKVAPGAVVELTPWFWALTVVLAAVSAVLFARLLMIEPTRTAAGKTEATVSGALVVVIAAVLILVLAWIGYLVYPPASVAIAFCSWPVLAVVSRASAETRIARIAISGSAPALTGPDGSMHRRDAGDRKDAR